jgi:hemerythrin-like metal-binding protein
MVSYLTWKEQYSVGDKSLDAQHRQILATINDLYEAMEQQTDYKVVRPLLDRLVQYTVNHFRREEECMLAHQYPEFAQHKALHDKMRQKTLAWRDNANIVTGRDLLIFLKEWWCDHIQAEDKKYAPYLKAVAEV